MICGGIYLCSSKLGRGGTIGSPVPENLIFCPSRGNGFGGGFGGLTSEPDIPRDPPIAGDEASSSGGKGGIGGGSRSTIEGCPD